jgi:AcrR family transcriptional regulator
VRKRELIDAARKIFCEKGYEQTSIRDILEVIGGEVGMFYHYFRSKDEIFRLSVELFLEDYICEFSALFSETVTPKQAVDKLIALVYRNITMYKKNWAEKLHWSMAAAIQKEMLENMVPVVEQLIVREIEAGRHKGLGIGAARESARFLLYGISGVLHEKPLAEQSEDEYEVKLRLISEMVSKFMTGGEECGI